MEREEDEADAAEAALRAGRAGRAARARPRDPARERRREAMEWGCAARGRGARRYVGGKVAFATEHKTQFSLPRSTITHSPPPPEHEARSAVAAPPPARRAGAARVFFTTQRSCPRSLIFSTSHMSSKKAGAAAASASGKAKGAKAEVLQFKSPAEFFAENQNIAGFDNVRVQCWARGQKSDPPFLTPPTTLRSLSPRPAGRQGPLHDHPRVCGKLAGRESLPQMRHRVCFPPLNPPLSPPPPSSHRVLFLWRRPPSPRAASRTLR
jgi:hypothetical protein